MNKGHIARATLEATAWQTKEVVDAMNIDSGVDLTSLKVDGGMVHNELLMQFQADVLDVPVIRPTVAETTSLGAAYAAGLAARVLKEVKDLRANWGKDKEWSPRWDAAERDREYRFGRRPHRTDIDRERGGHRGEEVRRGGRDDRLSVTRSGAPATGASAPRPIRARAALAVGEVAVPSRSRCRSAAAWTVAKSDRARAHKPGLPRSRRAAPSRGGAPRGPVLGEGSLVLLFLRHVPRSFRASTFLSLALNGTKRYRDTGRAAHLQTDVPAGGTTVGVAWDAAMRGFATVLVERRPTSPTARPGATTACSTREGATRSRISSRRASASRRTGTSAVSRPTASRTAAALRRHALGRPRATARVRDRLSREWIPVEESSVYDVLRRERRLHPEISRAFAVPDGALDPWKLAWSCALRRRTRRFVLTYHRVAGLRARRRARRRRDAP